MTQFNLDEYKKNPKRKVVTRDGREVEILKTNRKDGVHPIIFTILDQNGIEQVHFCNKIGICTTLPSPNNFDLFFADEEDELTEFETRIYNLINFSDPYNYPSIKEVKEEAEILLDLARKEVEKDIEEGAIEFAKSYMEDVNPSFEKVQECEELWKWKMSCLKGINKAYKRGKQDALKDFPKWRRSNSFFNTGSKFELGKTSLRRFDGYEIPYSELEKLPKE